MTLPKPARKPKTPKRLVRKTPLRAVPVKKSAKPLPRNRLQSSPGGPESTQNPQKASSHGRAKKHPPMASLRDKADRLFSEYIRARDGRCITCGTTEALQCSHYYGKKARPAVRYDPRNAHAQCARCHLAHHKHDPGKYSDWMRGHYPHADLDALQARSRGIAKRDRAYYLAIIADLEATRATLS